MTKTVIASALLVSTATGAFAEWAPGEWPFLKTYDQAHLQRIALPLGGIGTGQISLGGRGELRDWAIMNVAGIGHNGGVGPNWAPFFAIRVSDRGDGTPVQRMLAGQVYPSECFGGGGEVYANHGIPRFANAEFDAAYPFGQARLSDPALPVRVRVKGFNPFIPGDSEASGLPVAALSYEVENLADSPLSVTVSGFIANFIGCDGTGGKPIRNRNAWREAADGSFRGVYMTSDGVDKKANGYGTIALVTEATDCSYRVATRPLGWNVELKDYWIDLLDDGVLTTAEPREEDRPTAALAVRKSVPAHGKANFTFYFTWSFPNRREWWGGNEVGNWYCNDYPDAWTAAEKILPRIPALERRTVAFVRDFLSATIPDAAKEAALFNLCTLRSPTVFREKGGHLMGYEGTWDNSGSCYGSCTHVWNYEQATAFLFGDLARTMRDVEIAHSLTPEGQMAFRAQLPIEKAWTGDEKDAADGQMGCVVKAYRDWQLFGDRTWLERYWPGIKLMLSWAWKAWDRNEDGVMEGQQHNTMDVRYWGPNPEIGFWYLAALEAGARMADAMGDGEFAAKCRRVKESGAKWMDARLFNGEYYEQIVCDGNPDSPFPPDSPNFPGYQMGACCLTDMFVGQYAAHVAGLGDLAADMENVRTGLRSIMKYNYRESFADHFNYMRTYAQGDEKGTIIASWPKGELMVPFPYHGEVWTGIEYGAAVEMIYQGMEADALKVVEAARSRHEGARRNPYSEPECGHHYARSMASWGLVPAYGRFSYSGVDRTMGFTGRSGRYFWSNGSSFGVCEVAADSAVLSVTEGSLDLAEFRIDGKKIASGVRIAAGEKRRLAR